MLLGSCDASVCLNSKPFHLSGGNHLVCENESQDKIMKCSLQHTESVTIQVHRLKILKKYSKTTFCTLRDLGLTCQKLFIFLMTTMGLLKYLTLWFLVALFSEAQFPLTLNFAISRFSGGNKFLCHFVKWGGWCEKAYLSQQGLSYFLRGQFSLHTQQSSDSVAF